MVDKSWLTHFPQLSRSELRGLKKSLDSIYLDFTREWGDFIEGLFDPLLQFLLWFENLLISTPWWLVMSVIAGLAFAASRSWKMTGIVAVALFVIGYFGMWQNTMYTLSIITVATLLAIVIGVPVGILMSRSNFTQAVVTPLLDIMQTMPAFVYLIPVVMLLGIGRVPGIIAVVIYAIPPVIRLTNLGIRLVDPEVLEAATAYGATPLQSLCSVQIPLALPTIMAGINQTIMMALGMVVIASMIGVKGLGQPVLQSINNQYFTLGLQNGLAIVAIAIIFDRVSQAYAQRKQKYMVER